MRHVVSDRGLQLVEHLVGLDLELVQRLALRVGSKADAATHIVDRGQVLDPQRVDDAQQHQPLEHADLLPDLRALALVSVSDELEQRLGDGLALAGVVERAQVRIGQ